MITLKSLLPAWFPYLVIIISCALLLNTLFQPGVPQTHDGHNHLARLANFYLVIKDDQFPPRWAPNLNYEFGYPVFNYNYYLPYIEAVVLFMIGFSLEESVKLVVVTAFLGAGCAFFWFLKTYVSTRSALVASVLFLASPQYLSQVFVRGNIGETVAWAIFILGLFLIQQLISTQNSWWAIGLSVSTAALGLAHNTVFLLGFPVWLVFSGVLLWQKGWGNIVWTVLLSYAFGIGLACYFLLPALFELDFITLPKVGLTKDFFDHFVYLQQFFWPHWGYGFSKPGPEDDFPFQLGLVLLMILGLGIGVGWHYYRSRLMNWSMIKQQGVFVFWGLVLVVSIFLMLPISKPIWDLVPFLKQIQFPWRLLFLATISATILAAWVMDHLPWGWLPWLGMGLALGYGMWIAKPQGRLHQDDYFYFAFPFTSSTNNENLPSGYDLYRVHEHKPRLADLNEVATFQEIMWKSNLHEYRVQAGADTIVVEKLAYFPGWTTYLNDHPIPIDTHHPDFPGVVTYAIPKGNHTVRTIFTDSTPARQWGNRISLVSFCLMLGFAISKFVRPHVKV